MKKAFDLNLNKEIAKMITAAQYKNYEKYNI
jgi:hypothetical protein